MKTLACLLGGVLGMAGGSLGQEERAPALLARGEDGKSSPLGVDAVEVTVQVVGNMAETVMTLRFRNDTDRVLEGELVFPLGEGRTVSGYALEVDGKMREGVAVPKSRGRAVFESVVRQQIDPGLLEWTKGNNFRTRVYPIPAKGFKSVRIGYEEELGEEKGKYVYRLPLGFKEAVGNFKIRVEVERAGMAANDLEVEGLALQRRKARTVVLEAEEKNFAAKGPIVVRMTPEAGPVVAVEESGGERYFYVVDRPEGPAGAEAAGRAKPESLWLIWDASNSGAERDVKKELELLGKFLSWAGEVTVRLSYLRNDLAAGGSFKVRGGDWMALRKELEAVRYDGGTRLGLVDLTGVPEAAVVLVTDGISTLGTAELKAGERPVFVVQAGPSAEHGLLRSVASQSGGAYVNLAATGVAEGLAALTGQEFSLLSVQVEGDETVREVYPSGRETVRGPLGVAGKLDGKAPVTLVLNYGWNEAVVVARKVRIDPEAHRSEAGLAARLWAQKKLVELEVDAERQREEIVKLAQAHGLVTRFTSLLVLDRVEDYVEHRIVPADPELRKEYERLLKNAPKFDRGNQEHLKEVLAMWKKRCAWHERKFPGIEDAVPRRFREVAEMMKGLRKELQGIKEKDLDAEEKKQVTAARKGLEEYAAMQKELERLNAVAEDDRGAGWGRELGLLGGRLGVLLEELGVDDAGADGFAARGGLAGGEADPFSGDGDGASLRRIFPVTPATPRERSSEPPELPNQVGRSNLDADPFGAPSPAKSEGEGEEGGGAGIALAEWDPKTPYLKALRKVEDGVEVEAVYFRWKAKSGKSSAFYLDVADFLMERNEKTLALRVLTNVAEMDLESVPLLRILGHRLDQLGELELAEEVFREVRELRDDEPQSARDLALVLEKRGKYREALDLLWSVVATRWDDRFPEIQVIALTELNALAARHPEVLDGSAIDQRFLQNLDCDVRIVLTWDADNTDIDLWVTDPAGELCFYGDPDTETGGHMTEDFTGGYGPEEFTIRRALPGAYRVAANYYGNRQQILAGATTVQAVLITNWGRPNEKREALTLRLKDEEDVVKVGVLEFGEK